MSMRLHIVVPDGLVERIDAARGPGQSRADWIRRAAVRVLAERHVSERYGLDPPAEQLGVVEQASVTGVGGGSPGVSKADLPAPAEQSRKPGATSPAWIPERGVPRRAERSHAATCRCPVCVPAKGQR